MTVPVASAQTNPQSTGIESFISLSRMARPSTSAEFLIQLFGSRSLSFTLRSCGSLVHQGQLINAKCRVQNRRLDSALLDSKGVQQASGVMKADPCSCSLRFNPQVRLNGSSASFVVGNRPDCPRFRAIFLRMLPFHPGVRPTWNRGTYTSIDMLQVLQHTYLVCQRCRDRRVLTQGRSFWYQVSISATCYAHAPFVSTVRRR